MSNRFNIVIKNDSDQSWKKEINTEIKADNAGWTREGNRSYCN